MNTRPTGAADPAATPQRSGARPLQVARIILSGLIMVGSRKTWEQGYASRATPAQIVIGALIGGIVLVASLLVLVRIVLALATA